MLSEAYSRRFVELEEKSSSLPFKQSSDGYGSYVPEGIWQHWATSAQSLIKAVFGEDSPHYQNFIFAFGKCAGSDLQLNVLQGIFRSAKEDFEGGYVFNVDLRVSGEVFGDFVRLAKQALDEGHKDVAAVLACAALEDALKRYATANGLSVEESEMAQVINAIKGKGLVQGAEAKLIGTFPNIRNKAMHAEWDKISEMEVGGVIGYVEQFLLKHFSG